MKRVPLGLVALLMSGCAFFDDADRYALVSVSGRALPVLTYTAPLAGGGVMESYLLWASLVLDVTGRYEQSGERISNWPDGKSYRTAWRFTGSYRRIGDSVRILPPSDVNSIGNDDEWLHVRDGGDALIGRTKVYRRQ